jgi:hypothetical protein
MIYEKKKNRTRVVTFGKGDWYETLSGEKLPIKSAPMIFNDLYFEFIQKNTQVVELEGQRVKAQEEGKDFDMEQYAKIGNEYLNLFKEIVIKVTEFQGFDIDEEWIDANLAYEDMLFYVVSVKNKTPIYTAEELVDTKKK